MHLNICRIQTYVDKSTLPMSYYWLAKQNFCTRYIKSPDFVTMFSGCFVVRFGCFQAIVDSQ